MITEMPILIPSKKEQQKIADTLSSIDDLINAQIQKIETLKLHKKGLLQGLFPDVNEHNG
jgi:type I restriction enzyme S subunit